MKIPGLVQLSKNFNLNDKRIEKLGEYRLLRVLFIVVLLSGFLSFLFSDYQQFNVPRYSVGDIARADVVVPYDVLIKDEAATESQKVYARENVLPVYRFDPLVGEGQITRFKTTFTQCRKDLESAGIQTQHGISKPASRNFFKKMPHELKAQILAELGHLSREPLNEELVSLLVQERFNTDMEQSISTTLKQVFSGYIVQEERNIVRKKENIELVNSVSAKEVTVPVSYILTLDQARKQIGGLLDRSNLFNPDSVELMKTFLSGLLAPNLKFDLELTRAREIEAAANVDPVLRQLKKGKVILRQGDEVSSDELYQIEAVRNLTPDRFSLKKVSAMTVLLAFLLLSFSFSLRPLSKGQWSFEKLLALCSVILIFNILLVKVFWFVFDSLSRNFVASPLNDKAYFFFALPFAAGGMLMALLTEERIALVFLIVNCVLLGQAAQSNYSGFFYILISSLVGVLVVRNAVQRVGIVGSGFKLGLVAMGLFLVLQISERAPMDFQTSFFGAALAFLSGPINASLLVFALPIIERLFLVTTEIRLSELGNHNLPLIRELILKAPGTYNHSIAVGTLAEGAAKAIGLNPLFVRVACLYHDIGKSLHPEYFIENQQGTNPHERLSPEESVQLLKEHVTEGIRIANAANLPPSIVDVIPQHHGTKPLTFFLEKAKRLAGADVIHLRQEEFRYPGPKPQSKEAAIIMLADGVEAAARVLETHNQETILALIQKIVSSTAEDGQFSECEISLGDIERITFSFLETLSSFYHSRLSYPGFDFDLQKKADGSTLKATRATD